MSQFTISAQQFARALEQVVPVVPSNPLVSSTSCVLLVGRGAVAGAGATLHLVCTNLETRLVTNVAFECAEHFTLCVDARLLLTTLKSFPDAPINGTVAGESLIMKVGKSRYQLVGESAEGFPKASKPGPNEGHLSLPSSLLHRALSATLSMANTTTNVASPFTNGILVEGTDTHVAFVSTCLTRLAALTIAADDEELGRAINRSDQPFRLLIPRSAASYLHKMIDPKAETEVTLKFQADSVRLADHRWQTRLMDVSFPEYRPIFPPSYAQQLILERDELLAALRRLSAYTGQNDAVVMHIEADGSLTLHADNIVVGHSGEERLAGLSYYGEAITIGFPASQLANLLALWGPGPLTLGMNGPQRGTILTQEGDSADSGLACMIAPAMILSSEHSYS